jgi:hypothetical protein
MFVQCVIRRSRNNQRYALIGTNPLFYILAPTRFSSSLPSSGSFIDISELLEIQIEWMVYHIMCGYVACVLDCRGTDGTTTIQHTPAHRPCNHTLRVYDIPPIRFVFKVTQKDLRS